MELGAHWYMFSYKKNWKCAIVSLHFFPMNFTIYICTHYCIHSETIYVDILVCRAFSCLSSACYILWLISRVLLHCYISTPGHTLSSFFILRVISGCGWHFCLESRVCHSQCFSMRMGSWQLHIDSVMMCWSTTNFSYQMEMQIHLFTHACMHTLNTIGTLCVQYMGPVLSGAVGIVTAHSGIVPSRLETDRSSAMCTPRYVVHIYVPSTHAG